MAGIAGTGLKWLEMDGNDWKWLDLVEMAGNDWKWLHMTRNGWNSWILLKIPRDGWGWLEMARNCWNGWIRLKMANSGLTLPITVSGIWRLRDMKIWGLEIGGFPIGFGKTRSPGPVYCSYWGKIAGKGGSWWNITHEIEGTRHSWEQESSWTITCDIRWMGSVFSSFMVGSD